MSSPNFVTFTIRHKQKRHLTISLRGNPSEFDVSPDLSLKEGRAGAYSECNVTSPRQLAAATAYVQRAYELYKRGASRVRRKVTRRDTASQQIRPNQPMQRTRSGGSFPGFLFTPWSSRLGHVRGGLLADLANL